MKQRGLTLIELIASISVIAMAGAALMGTLTYLADKSSLGLRQAQAQAIADAYLNGITGRSFADVAGYNGLDTTEAGYRVRVALSSGGLTLLPNNAVWRVDVTVNYDANAVVVATGYRTNRP
jgi:prepilin-type N-terminal cleavage/methylation domain-containing protein